MQRNTCPALTMGVYFQQVLSLSEQTHWKLPKWLTDWGMCELSLKGNEVERMQVPHVIGGAEEYAVLETRTSISMFRTTNRGVVQVIHPWWGS